VIERWGNKNMRRSGDGGEYKPGVRISECREPSNYFNEPTEKEMEEIFGKK
jgi:hypothetical protein